MYGFMAGRLRKQEDDDRLYTLQLQRDLETSQNDLESLNSHLMVLNRIKIVCKIKPRRSRTVRGFAIRGFRIRKTD